MLMWQATGPLLRSGALARTGLQPRTPSLITPSPEMTGNVPASNPLSGKLTTPSTGCR